MAINTLYLDNGILKSANLKYHSQNPNSISLRNIFQPPVFSLIQKKLYESEYSRRFKPFQYMYHATKLKEIGSFIKGYYFTAIAKKILGIGNFKVNYEIRQFQAGDYTLLHDAISNEPAIDFVIDFSKSADNYGGYTVYLNEGEELLHLNPHPNTLSFVEKKPGMMKYTKYVTHRQKRPILQVCGSIFEK